ncbi:hypothetical protein BDQ17DRAFT_55087 [Cyathus striatus]|nr:hypothetical protein BDQ17DRAFT_55087 [Cyathus striatus]
MPTIILPEGYSYVCAALLSTVFVLFGQGTVVSRYRKRSGIEYPQMYAERSQANTSKDAHIFNCAQRAHQNTLENIPLIYLTTIITGFEFPIFAALTCASWCIARISYTRGYITGDPSERATTLYKLSFIPLLGSLLVSVYITGKCMISEFGLTNGTF